MELTCFFLRMESSRWNLLGGVLQDRFCPMEFNYFLVTRWNSLGGILYRWNPILGWNFLAFLFFRGEVV